MNTYVFLITAKTNLHVGNESGGEFTIIDKAIQRDPLTLLPCINSSSLKGAIKEYCVYENEKRDQEEKIDVEQLFGSDVDIKTGKVKSDSKKGGAIFFDAKLLYLPQQNDSTLYHYITSNDIVKMMVDRVHLFNKDFSYEKPDVLNGKDVKFDENITSLSNNDNLPIIARNVLENGESKNLWYEQVLPAETVLYTIIREEGEVLKKALDGKVVQIGANATIGYGYCKFDLLCSK